MRERGDDPAEAAERSPRERETVLGELGKIANELNFAIPETLGAAVLNRNPEVTIESAMGTWREQAEAIADQHAESPAYYQVQAGLTVAQAEVLLRAEQTEAAIDAIGDAAEYASQLGMGEIVSRLQAQAAAIRGAEPSAPS